jgi:putative oxidoreductase
MDLGTLLYGTNPSSSTSPYSSGESPSGCASWCMRWESWGSSVPERWLASLSGSPRPQFQARLAMISELVGGVLLTLGLATSPAALALIITMAVAGLMGHRGAGYLITNNPPGAEYTLNLAVVCLMFLLIGPGTISLDATLF